MRHPIQWLPCLLLLCALAAVAEQAPGEPAEPPRTIEAALHAMFARAGVVFTGEVLSIERSSGDLVVRWRVDNPVRGVAAGTPFTQRVWAAAGDADRYTVGQRALVLLMRNAVSGYASPVDGADGIIPLQGDSASSTVDLRWIAQHVQVRDTARLRPVLALRAAGASFAGNQRVPTQDATGREALPRPLVEDDPPEAGAEPPSAEPAPVDGAVVLGMSRAWQRAESGR